jgi:hypothetical protein
VAAAAKGPARARRAAGGHVRHGDDAHEQRGQEDLATPTRKGKPEGGRQGAVHQVSASTTRRCMVPRPAGRALPV